MCTKLLTAIIIGPFCNAGERSSPKFPEACGLPASLLAQAHSSPVVLSLQLDIIALNSWGSLSRNSEDRNKQHSERREEDEEALLREMSEWKDSKMNITVVFSPSGLFLRESCWRFCSLTMPVGRVCKRSKIFLSQAIICLP